MKIVAYAAIIATPVFGSQFIATTAHAQLGCCMVRDSQNVGVPWVQTNWDFARCEQENQERDGVDDNLFEPTGIRWWNLQC